MNRDANLFGEPARPAPAYQDPPALEVLRLFTPAPAPIPGQLDIAAQLQGPDPSHDR